LKCFGKCEDYIAFLNRSLDNQVFQDWIFLIHGHDELLHLCHKADTGNAITMLKSEDYLLFIFCGDVTTFPKVIEDEWEAR
jgi:hypothetical protein